MPSSNSWTISLGQLQKWHDKLDNYSVTEVQEEIEGILNIMKSTESYESYSEGDLTMADIEVGQTYYFKPDPRTRNEYHNRSCKVIKKNRTRVVVELLEDVTGRIKRSDEVSVRVEHLIRKPQIPGL